MEIFDGLYMRSRLSPWLSLKTEAKTLKINVFSRFRLIYSFLIFALLVKNKRFFAVFKFDYVQASGLAFTA
jgi:hypothetical protein